MISSTLCAQIKAALPNVLGELFRELQNYIDKERVYVFALSLDDSAESVFAAANTIEAFGRRAERIRGKNIEVERTYVKWSCGEWSYSGFLPGRMETVSRLLRDLSETDDGAPLDRINLVSKIMAEQIEIFLNALSLEQKTMLTDDFVAFISVSDSDNAEDIENMTVQLATKNEMAVSKFLNRYSAKA